MVVFGNGADEARLALPVLRVQAGIGLIVSIQSHRSFGVGTHYIGRPYICPGPECPACHGQDPRWRVFVIVRGVSKSDGGPVAQTPWLLETSAARWPFSLDYELEGFLSKTLVQVSRRKSRGVLSVAPLEDRDTRSPIHPEWPDLVNAVSRLHGIRGMGAKEIFDDWRESVRPELVKRISDALRRDG